MQAYIDLYLASLTSDASKGAVVKNLRAALKRTPHASKADSNESVLSFEWHALTIQEYSDLRTALVEEGKSTSYINTVLTIVRKTLNWAFISDKLTETAYEKIKHAIKSVKSNAKKHAKSNASNDEVDLTWLEGKLDNLSNLTSESDLGALPAATVNQVIGSIGTLKNISVRNRAIFMCMSHAGLRREEVANLRLQDIRFSKSGHKESFISVLGKGAKLRDVPMNSELHKALMDWARIVLTTNNKKRSAPLFRKVNIVDKVLDNGLSTTGVYNVIRKAGEADNVTGLHPHALRHYFATRLLLNGRDIFEVAKLLGHSNVDTTRRYDDRGFKDLQSAVEFV
ncbi:MAG: site-specific integrase [Aestuariibacter sp.]|nr:site-specific integrase [Aestuariibacter sp.]